VRGPRFNDAQPGQAGQQVSLSGNPRESVGGARSGQQVARDAIVALEHEGLYRTTGQRSAGAALAIGGRIHGVVNSFRSAQRRLGLYQGMVLIPIPLHVNGQTTLGLGASWQF
jgi:hypothetical protein